MDRHAACTELAQEEQRMRGSASPFHLAGFDRRTENPMPSSSRRNLVRATGLVALTAMLSIGSLAEAASQPVWKAGIPPALVDVPAGVSPKSIVFDGALHLFSYDPVDGNLHHATWDRSAWSSDVIDGAGGSGGRIDADVGIGPSAVVWNDRLNVFYGDATNSELRRAYRSATSTSWTIETIATHGGGETAAILDQASPHVFYHDPVAGDLRHIHLRDGAWSGGRLDGGTSTVAHAIEGNLGAGVSAVWFEGHPHAYYYDATHGDLRHTWRRNAGWSAETIDGAAGGDVGADTSAVVVDLGPQVFYFDATNGNLKRARWDGSDWKVQSVDGHNTSSGRVNGVVGTGSSARVHKGTPYVAYHDVTNGDLRLAWIVNGAWQFATLDGNGTNDGRTTAVVGASTSIVSYYGNLHVLSETPSVSPTGETRLRRSWLNDPELEVAVLSDSMLAKGTQWWPWIAAAINAHPDLVVGTNWGISGSTAVALIQNKFIANGQYVSQPADVLLASFAFNDLNPRPFWGANADASALAWAQLTITLDAKAAGYRCVVWLQQRSRFHGELVTRHGFTPTEATVLESRLIENRANLDLLRSVNLEQEPAFRVGLVDWAGLTNGPTDDSLFADGLHPSAGDDGGGEWIGEQASKAMAECD
jgi:hypothetical protein